MCYICDRVLSSLLSIPACMTISLGILWIKDAFLECTNLLKTPHGLIKKNASHL